MDTARFSVILFPLGTALPSREPATGRRVGSSGPEVAAANAPVARHIHRLGTLSSSSHEQHTNNKHKQTNNRPPPHTAHTPTTPPHHHQFLQSACLLLAVRGGGSRQTASASRASSTPTAFDARQNSGFESRARPTGRGPGLSRPLAIPSKAGLAAS
jgi:hypothetical protein